MGGEVAKLFVTSRLGPVHLSPILWYCYSPYKSIITMSPSCPLCGSIWTEACGLIPPRWWQNLIIIWGWSQLPSFKAEAWFQEVTIKLPTVSSHSPYHVREMTPLITVWEFRVLISAYPTLTSQGIPRKLYNLLHACVQGRNIIGLKYIKKECFINIFPYITCSEK